MKKQEKVNKLLRSRVFWFFFVPLAIVIVNCFIHQTKSLEGFHVVFLNFLIGAPVFPAFSLAGLGININSLPKALLLGTSIGIYVFFGYFILNRNKLSNKHLYLISIILLLFIALGLRACSIEETSNKLFFM